MTRFLVTGASGLLGLNFALQAAREHQVTGVVNRSSLRGAPFALAQADLSLPGEVERLLDETRPEVVLHCAAMAILDECEAQPERAWRINAELPGELAAAAQKRGIRMVHISTDSVFDGQRGNYGEEDQPNPISVYARGKLAGEEAVRSAYPQALIARTNFYGWSLRGKRSLAEFFFNNLSTGRQVNGFTDVYFCPLLVNELADLLLEMVERDLRGLYHVYSAECLSKYDFGLRIARAFGLDASLIQPVSHEVSGLVAARSPKLTMNSDRLAAALGHALPDQQSGIDGFYQLYRQGFPEQVRAMTTELA